MKIALDARMYQESGIGRYIRNLIAEIEILDRKNQYFVLLTKKDFKELNFKKNFQKVLADFKWYGLKEQIKLPKILYSLKVDLVHFPHFNIPIFFRGKFIVTVHDLIHQHYQMRRVTLHDPITYKIKQLGYKRIFKNAISKSLKILVPSNYVKDLLINECGINTKKILVTPEAADDKILSAVSKMSTIKSPYLFYVGNAHPHKNVEGLIKTFLKLKQLDKDLKLVLSGSDHYFWQRVKKEFTQKDIIYTEYVTDEELVFLYKNAEVFVMPSFEEGFGIPLLEAMAVGCPVVSSDAGSLKEVGGDAALYFDPKNENDMIEKISQILNSEKLRKELITKGKKRVKLFSWKKLAEQTLEEYLKCM